MSAKKRKATAKASADPPGETRAADAATIGWMLSVLAGLVCQAASLGLAWLARMDPNRPQLDMAASALFFAALVIGVVIAAMTPFVYKLRRVLPPRSITAFALFVAAMPWMVLVVRLAQG